MLKLVRASLLYPIAETLLKRDIRSKVARLRSFESQSREDKSAQIQENLHRVLSSASKHVPYYRDLFREIGFDPNRILQSPDYLQEIPLLTKEILREQGTRMLDERFAKEQLHARETNGSTGLTTTIWYDQESLDWTAAVSLFATESSGSQRTQSSALLSSRFFEKKDSLEIAKEKLKCWALNRENILTHAFDETGLQDLLSSLKKAKVHAIQGHPSTAYFLALYARKQNLDVKNLFSIYQSTGESLDKSKVQIIEDTFGCRVFNRYGNAEFGVIAQSRKNFDELEVIESIVLPESHSLGNGLEELVMTGLRNTAMPLIRYKTGDIGDICRTDEKTIIRRLHGRIHDVVELNGQQFPTHFIKDVLERIGGFDEFQLIQSINSDSTVLKLVPNQRFNRNQVENRISELFGNALKLETTSLEGLVLQGWRDKFRYLVKR